MKQNDIFLDGRDEELLRILQTVLQRTREHGIIFYKEKREFEKGTELTHAIIK